MKALGVALVALGCATPSAILVPVRVEHAVREAIAADWPPPVETLRCLIVRPYDVNVPGSWLVVGVRRVPNRDATQYSVRGECPDSTVALHDHLPVTCFRIGAQISCLPGGDLAHLCSPSENDRKYLAARPHQPFNGVRCDARALVFYRVR